MAITLSPLMKRFIVTVFSLYLVLAVLVSVVHVVFEYRYIRNQIAIDLESIYTSSSQSLSGAVWNFDTEQVEKVINGLLTLNFVSGIELNNQVDGVDIVVGDVNFSHALSYKGPIIHSEGEIQQMLGEIHLYSNRSVIFDRIKVNVAFIIANAFLKTLFLSIIIMIVGSRIIGRPLSQLLESVDRLDFDNLENSKVKFKDDFYDQKNELTELVYAYNYTLDKLMRRTKQRNEARKELEEKNLNLEELVNQKTLALQDKVDELNDVNQRLEVLASTDSLTGLLNRRYFFERSENELSRIRRNKKQAGILIVDIDYFKSVNDQYGHPAGDAVLVVIAKILKNNVRKHDLVARFGGEEFAIFLVDMDLEQSAALAERVRKNIESQKVIYKGEVIKATASIGLSMLTDESQSVDEVLGQADKLLYEAKEAGRNILKY